MFQARPLSLNGALEGYSPQHFIVPGPSKAGQFPPFPFWFPGGAGAQAESWSKLARKWLKSGHRPIPCCESSNTYSIAIIHISAALSA